MNERASNNCDAEVLTLHLIEAKINYYWSDLIGSAILEISTTGNKKVAMICIIL